MGVTSTVDVKLLNECFELHPYGKLIKDLPEDDLQLEYEERESSDRPVKVIFAGPPGAGSQTQANHLCDHYGCVKVVATEIPAVKERLDAGESVEDDHLIEAVDARLQEEDCGVPVVRS